MADNVVVSARFMSEDRQTETEVVMYHHPNIDTYYVVVSTCEMEKRVCNDDIFLGSVSYDAGIQAVKSIVQNLSHNNWSLTVID